MIEMVVRMLKKMQKANDTEARQKVCAPRQRHSWFFKRARPLHLTLQSALIIFALTFLTPAIADDFSVYFDTDRNPSTGCTVTVSGGQPLNGIDFKINAIVTRSPPTVSTVTIASCQDSASGIFGPATPLPAGIDVGLNNGLESSDVIEFDAALTDLNLLAGDRVNLFLTASDGRSEILQGSVPGLTVPGDVEYTEIPTLSAVGMATLVVLILTIAWRLPASRSWLFVFGFLLAPGVARLAMHVSDGMVGDWAGETPLISSPAGDTSTPETDVRFLFLAEETGRLYYRIDVTELEAATPPTAVITVDNPNPKVGAREVLPGAGSDPVSGTALTYAWTLDQAPAGSAVTIASTASADQSFVPDLAGAYVFGLVVTNSGGASSAPVSATVTATAVLVNSAPHAVIDAPQDVSEGSLIQLSGAGSSDADLDALTYAWTLVTKPTGSAAALDAAAQARTRFTGDLPGSYVVELVVNDGTLDSTVARETITVHPVSVNAPPTVDAGPEQHVLVSQQVELRQSSSDPEGDTVTLSWRVVTRPDPSSTAQVQQIPRSPKAELHYVFTPDVAGAFVLELIGTDPAGNVATDRVRVIADSPAATPHPIANAGADQVVKVGDTVTLDGRQSYDADGPATLTYQWSLTSKPMGSTAAVTNPASATPSFVPDVEGDYVFQLVAIENGVNSAPDSVTVTANAAAPPVSLYQQLLDLGLDATDAHYLESNHAAEAQAVVASTDRIFQGFALADDMFSTSAGPGAPSFSGVCPGPNFIPWTNDAKTRFRKIFGRINFVINTSRFRQAFDAQAKLLNPAYQDSPPTWKPYPADYAEFRDAITQALADGGDALTLFLCTNTNGTAYGVPPLRLMVDEQMMGKTVVTGGNIGQGWGVNGAAPLVFHELTHSFAYAHDGPDAEILGKPNNIPYFVQIMLGYNGEDILQGYCGGSVDSCNRFYLANSDPANKGLLTAYFGTD